MKETIKAYKNMTNKEKAQAIYDAMNNGDVHNPRLNPLRFKMLMKRLLTSYANGEILTVKQWIESYKNKDFEDLSNFAKVCHESFRVNLDDRFIRVSIYYDGYMTSNDITQLITKSEAINWIKSALDCHDPRIQHTDKFMQENN